MYRTLRALQNITRRLFIENTAVPRPAMLDWYLSPRRA